MSETESEQIIRFIQSLLIVYTCLAYTYAIGKIVPSGKVRSLFISPVIAVFLFLPLRFTSVALCSGTGVFISWVANFKLALFSFGKGPLASDYQTITFSRFLAVGSLPIILSLKSKMKEKRLDNIDHDASMKARLFAVKILLFALVYKLFKFEAQLLHPAISFYMYGVHMYLSLEFFVFGCRAIVEALLGLELEPQFNEPILSTSVQNFWGQRWNLVVGNILRFSVYDPVRALLSPHVGSKHAQRLSVLATFGVSSVMHEIIFFYVSRKRPTWDMTGFFLLHGVTVVVETEVKRRIGQKWRLPRLVSILLTLSFMSVTGFLVFLPKVVSLH
ncbi:unnamed protein product [Rhodiola kirilowii]